MLRRLLKLVPGRRPAGGTDARYPGSGAQQGADMERRVREIYGGEKLDQQLLYERWVSKDTWHLRHEALPLLFGIDPDAYKKERNPGPMEEAIRELREHAVQCIEHGLLPVTNRIQPPQDWKVEPLQIYQWAVVSRLHLPEPLVALMEFIGSTVKRPAQAVVADPMPDGRKISAAFDDDREKILGLALAVLAACPERCRDAAGEITAERILASCKVLAEQHQRPLHLADGAMLDLINKWLQVLPPAANKEERS